MSKVIKTNRENYVTPSLETSYVEVEQGFSATGTLPDFNEGEDGPENEL